MNQPSAHDPVPEKERPRFTDHLWWIVEVFGIMLCLLAWAFVHDARLLVYAIMGVVFLGLVFRLSRYAIRRR
jgi:hypothetical protein